MMIVALVPTFLFALTAVFATRSSRILGAEIGNLARLILAILFLSIWFGVGGDVVHGKPAYLFILAGAVGFGMGGWFMFQALGRLGSTLALLIVECASAVWASAMGWVLLQAPLSHSDIFFASISISGVVIGLFPGERLKVERSKLFLGIAFAVVASLGQAISFTISKEGFLQLAETSQSVSPLSASFYRLCGGTIMAVCILGVARLLSRGSSQERHLPSCSLQHSLKRAWGWVVLNALAGPVFGVTAMLWAIREVDNPGMVQAVVACATLLSVPFSRFLEGQKLPVHYFIGAIISIVGSAGLILDLSIK